MLEILQENGHIKRTQLAGKTGLNYNKCIKYINLLKILGWADVIFDETYYVTITQSGKDAAKSLLAL